MAHIVNMHEAKSTLSKLVLHAESGEEIIIARAGKPVAKIVPYTEPARAKILGSLKGIIAPLSEQQWAESDREIEKLWNL